MDIAIIVGVVITLTLFSYLSYLDIKGKYKMVNLKEVTAQMKIQSEEIKQISENELTKMKWEVEKTLEEINLEVIKERNRNTDIEFLQAQVSSLLATSAYFKMNKLLLMLKGDREEMVDEEQLQYVIRIVEEDRHKMMN